MQHPNETYIAQRTGDKVRISSGAHKNQRGIIQTIIGDSLEVKLDSGELVSISPQQVTNFSLAARKAWQTMRKQ